jgi:hypothetical protein
MEKLLNGSSIEQLTESLANILQVSTPAIHNFVQSQQYRITTESNGIYYDNLTFEDITEHFQLDIDNLSIDGITVSHVSAILDLQSFYDHGMLSLKDLFVIETPFKAFLREFGIDLLVEDNDTLSIRRGDLKVSSDHLNLRMTRDRCINGFLFADNPETIDDVEEMLKCPEFVLDIGRHIFLSRDLEEAWKSRATPSVITFKALFSELDASTFDTEDSDEAKSQLITASFEKLLFHSQRCDDNNLMIYLKEEVSIGADRILSIREI